MADFTYTQALANFPGALIDWDTDDIRLILVMSNTTADTDEDAATVAAMTTLDEFDGTGYPTTYATRSALINEAIIKNTSLDRGELDANDFVWASLGAGIRQAEGIVVYKQTGSDDTGAIPIFWFDSGGFPFTANGSDVTVQWNVAGIALVQNS